MENNKQLSILITVAGLTLLGLGLLTSSASASAEVCAAPAASLGLPKAEVAKVCRLQGGKAYEVDGKLQCHITEGSAFVFEFEAGHVKGTSFLMKGLPQVAVVDIIAGCMDIFGEPDHTQEGMMGWDRDSFGVVVTLKGELLVITAVSKGKAV